MRILPTENSLFCGKQRISLSNNFPVQVNDSLTRTGKLVDKEILCLPLNFPLTYHMHAGNLEDRRKIPSCTSNEGNTRFIFPRNVFPRNEFPRNLLAICLLQAELVPIIYFSLLVCKCFCIFLYGTNKVLLLVEYNYCEVFC